MIKGKQIAVIGLVVVLMALLLSLDIKGLVKGERGQPQQETSAAPSGMPVEQLVTMYKHQLSPASQQEIGELESKLSDASGGEKIRLQNLLSQKWDDLNQPAPAAVYAEQSAQSSNKLNDWLKAGGLYTQAYEATKDSTIQPGLVAKAAESYQRALDLQAGNLDAKTGLGSAMVNGSGNPMAGITILLEVVKEDPENVNANMNLGMFSIRSGQFDKAVERFRTVLKHRQTADVWFYLATCYENTGEKKAAIDAFEQTRKLSTDATFSDYIDKRIQELKK